MGDLSRFLKKNKKTKENLRLAATTTLTDEKGKPLTWEVRPLTTKEDNALREECTVDVQVTGKPGMFRPKFNANRYLARMAAACVVYPNLNDKELQDSYGVMAIWRRTLPTIASINFTNGPMSSWTLRSRNGPMWWQLCR